MEYMYSITSAKASNESDVQVLTVKLALNPPPHRRRAATSSSPTTDTVQGALYVILDSTPFSPLAAATF